MTRQVKTKQVTAKQVMMLGMTVVLTAGLSACSDFRRAIGEGKSAPDEFQVVVRAPLSLPPGFGDSPEDIMKSSQTSGVTAQASTANLLGSQTVEGSEFTSLFDFSGVPDVGPVLDKMAEDLRLRKARLAGQAPTEGGTKAIDPASDQPLTVN